MADLFEPTIDDEIRCVERELALRRVVYPRRVADKRMSEKSKDHELRTMEAVLKRLQDIKESAK